MSAPPPAGLSGSPSSALPLSRSGSLAMSMIQPASLGDGFAGELPAAAQPAPLPSAVPAAAGRFSGTLPSTPASSAAGSAVPTQAGAGGAAAGSQARDTVQSQGQQQGPGQGAAYPHLTDSSPASVAAAAAAAATGAVPIPQNRREIRGLRHFSLRVCELLASVGATSYNGLANLLVDDARVEAARDANIDVDALDAAGIAAAVGAIADAAAKKAVETALAKSSAAATAAAGSDAGSGAATRAGAGAVTAETAAAAAEAAAAAAAVGAETATAALRAAGHAVPESVAEAVAAAAAAGAVRDALAPNQPSAGTAGSAPATAGAIGGVDGILSASVAASAAAASNLLPADVAAAAREIRCRLGTPLLPAPLLEFDEKNIRRRVYDALNVLKAVGAIDQVGRDVVWRGFAGPAAKLEDLMWSVAERRVRILHKRARLQRLVQAAYAAVTIMESNALAEAKRKHVEDIAAAAAAAAAASAAAAETGNDLEKGVSSRSAARGAAAAAAAAAKAAAKAGIECPLADDAEDAGDAEGEGPVLSVLLAPGDASPTVSTVSSPVVKLEEGVVKMEDNDDVPAAVAAAAEKAAAAVRREIALARVSKVRMPFLLVSGFPGQPVSVERSVSPSPSAPPRPQEQPSSEGGADALAAVEAAASSNVSRSGRRSSAPCPRNDLASSVETLPNAPAPAPAAETGWIASETARMRGSVTISSPAPLTLSSPLAMLESIGASPRVVRTMPLPWRRAAIPVDALASDVGLLFNESHAFRQHYQTVVGVQKALSARGAAGGAAGAGGRGGVGTGRGRGRPPKTPSAAATAAAAAAAARGGSSTRGGVSVAVLESSLRRYYPNNMPPAYLQALIAAVAAAGDPKKVLGAPTGVGGGILPAEIRTAAAEAAAAAAGMAPESGADVLIDTLLAATTGAAGGAGTGAKDGSVGHSSVPALRALLGAVRSGSLVMLGLLRDEKGAVAGLVARDTTASTIAAAAANATGGAVIGPVHASAAHDLTSQAVAALVAAAPGTARLALKPVCVDPLTSATYTGSGEEKAEEGEVPAPGGDAQLITLSSTLALPDAAPTTASVVVKAPTTLVPILPSYAGPLHGSLQQHGQRHLPQQSILSSLASPLSPASTTSSDSPPPDSADQGVGVGPEPGAPVAVAPNEPLLLLRHGAEALALIPDPLPHPIPFLSFFPALNSPQSSRGSSSPAVTAASVAAAIAPLLPRPRALPSQRNGWDMQLAEELKQVVVFNEQTSFHKRKSVVGGAGTGNGRGKNRSANESESENGTATGLKGRKRASAATNGGVSKRAAAAAADAEESQEQGAWQDYSSSGADTSRRRSALPSPPLFATPAPGAPPGTGMGVMMLGRHGAHHDSEWAATNPTGVGANAPFPASQGGATGTDPLMVVGGALMSSFLTDPAASPSGGPGHHGSSPTAAAAGMGGVGAGGFGFALSQGVSAAAVAAAAASSGAGAGSGSGASSGYLGAVPGIGMGVYSQGLSQVLGSSQPSSTTHQTLHALSRRDTVPAPSPALSAVSATAPIGPGVGSGGRGRGVGIVATPSPSPGGSALGALAAAAAAVDAASAQQGGSAHGHMSSLYASQNSLFGSQGQGGYSALSQTQPQTIGLGSYAAHHHHSAHGHHGYGHGHGQAGSHELISSSPPAPVSAGIPGAAAAAAAAAAGSSTTTTNPALGALAHRTTSFSTLLSPSAVASSAMQHHRLSVLNKTGSLGAPSLQRALSGLSDVPGAAAASSSKSSSSSSSSGSGNRLSSSANIYSYGGGSAASASASGYSTGPLGAASLAGASLVGGARLGSAILSPAAGPISSGVLPGGAGSSAAGVVTAPSSSGMPGRRLSTGLGPALTRVAAAAPAGSALQPQAQGQAQGQGQGQASKGVSALAKAAASAALAAASLSSPASSSSSSKGETVGHKRTAAAAPGAIHPSVTAVALAAGGSSSEGNTPNTAPLHPYPLTQPVMSNIAPIEAHPASDDFARARRLSAAPSISADAAAAAASAVRAGDLGSLDPFDVPLPPTQDGSEL